MQGSHQDAAARAGDRQRRSSSSWKRRRNSNLRTGRSLGIGSSRKALREPLLEQEELTNSNNVYSPRGNFELVPKTAAAVLPLSYCPPQHHHHHHQQPTTSSTSPRGDVELGTLVSSSSAFQLAQGHNRRDLIPNNRLPPSQEFMVRGNDPVSNNVNHYSQPAYSILERQANRNPAVDLASPLLSHGCLCVQCVRTQELGISEQFGEFQGILEPGFYCLPWPISTIGGRLTLRIQQLDILCETRTSDDVFCYVDVSVLYRVSVVRSYEAYYRLADPRIQIQSFVLDVLRSAVPSMTLDEVFHSKDQIADAIFTRLHREMLEYGYEITATLVTNVVPNELVRESMNELNASRRYKQAAPYKAEALKVQKVKQAEANAEAAYMNGVGVASKRKAIAKGMREDVDTWTTMDVRIVNPPAPEDVMYLLLVTQYLDLLTSVGADCSTSPSSLFLEHDDLLIPKSVQKS